MISLKNKLPNRETLAMIQHMKRIIQFKFDDSCTCAALCVSRVISGIPFIKPCFRIFSLYAIWFWPVMPVSETMILVHFYSIDFFNQYKLPVSWHVVSFRQGTGIHGPHIKGGIIGQVWLSPWLYGIDINYRIKKQFGNIYISARTQWIWWRRWSGLQQRVTRGRRCNMRYGQFEYRVTSIMKLGDENWETNQS